MSQFPTFPIPPAPPGYPQQPMMPGQPQPAPAPAPAAPAGPFAQPQPQQAPAYAAQVAPQQAPHMVAQPPSGYPAGYPAAPQPQAAPQGYQAPTAPAQPQAAQYGASPLQSMLAGMRAAVPPSLYGLSFSHPQGAEWKPGQPGAFDGVYRLRLDASAYDNRDAGQVYRLTFTVLEGTNPAVAAGSQREVPCFMWKAPARSDAQGYTQVLYEACGHPGAYTDAFAASLFGAPENNQALGREFFATVQTKGKKSKPLEPFTKVTLQPAPVAS